MYYLIGLDFCVNLFLKAQKVGYNFKFHLQKSEKSEKRYDHLCKKITRCSGFDVFPCHLLEIKLTSVANNSFLGGRSKMTSPGGGGRGVRQIGD